MKRRHESLLQIVHGILEHLELRLQQGDLFFSCLLFEGRTVSKQLLHRIVRGITLQRRDKNIIARPLLKNYTVLASRLAQIFVSQVLRVEGITITDVRPEDCLDHVFRNGDWEHHVVLVLATAGPVDVTLTNFPMLLSRQSSK